VRECVGDARSVGWVVAGCLCVGGGQAGSAREAVFLGGLGYR
jgi:hypothetical protein